MMKKDKLYKLALSIYGVELQKQVCIEEMSKLTKELCKMSRCKGNIESIAEEIADVEIMIEQMKQAYDIHEKVSQYKYKKLKRLEQHLAIQFVRKHKEDFDKEENK